MKKLLSVLLAAVLLVSVFTVAVSAAGQTTVSLSDSNITYLGRWVDSSANTKKANFNAALEMRFTGTSVSVVLGANSGFVYAIDDEPYIDVTSANGTYALATGLSDGVHTLKMAVRQHSVHIYLNGFVLDDGAATVTPLKKQTVEFIGDSITAGWIGNNFPNDNKITNTYGFMAAEDLNLYHDTVALGGISVVPGYGSPDNGGIQNRYYRIGENEAGVDNSAAWDTSKYQPDYLVLNLGTNDSAAADVFSSNYTTFLTALRGSYPNAKMVVMTPFNGSYRAQIRSVVEQLNASGDKNVYFLDTLGWVESTDTTDGVHLSVAAQTRCGQFLSHALSNLIADGEIGEIDPSVISGGKVKAEKYLYSDFNAGLSTAPTATGNGEHTVYVYHNENTTYSCSNGALNLTLPQGSYLRLMNSANGFSRFKYFVVRLKGDASQAGTNAVKLWFGSYGTPGAALNIRREEVTDEYTDVLFEMPAQYFDSIGTAYQSCLFIESTNTSTVSLNIDEMYFCTTYPVEDEESDAGEIQKTVYSDFSTALVPDVAVSNGDGGTITLFGTPTATQSVSNGALNLKMTDGKDIRFTSTVELCDENKKTNYEYMVIRVKGKATKSDGTSVISNAVNVVLGNWSNQVNQVYIKGTDLKENEYTDLVYELKDSTFSGINTGYRTTLILQNAGAFTTDIQIDEIYFYNEAPQTSGPINKLVYNDFNSGLGTSYGASTPVGDGVSTAYIVDNTLNSSSFTGGVAHLVIDNGKYLRTSSTITGLDSYKYLVLRMKGTFSEPLTGNAFGIAFGSGGDCGFGQNPQLYVPVEAVTPDYSDVVVEIPAGFFTSLNATYKYSIWVCGKRGATVTVDIDEIYLCDGFASGDHTHDYEETVVEATCTELGYTLRSCLCGDTYKAQFMPKRDHDLNYGVCTNCGTVVYMSGDVNGDETVDVRDLVALKKMMAGLTEQNVAADINEDGVLNAADVTALKAGILNEAPHSANVPLTAENVKLLGRVDTADASGKMTLEWTDSGLSFNFVGTRFSFDVTGQNTNPNFCPYVAYRVDGGDFTTVRVTKASAVTVNASGYQYGNHTVEIIRINEPINNPLYISNVNCYSDAVFGGAKLLKPNGAAEKRIMFIGDSITTAYGNIGSGLHSYDTADQDGTRSYAYMTAEYFGADYEIVAKEGRGIVNNNYTGYTDYMRDMIEVLSYQNNTQAQSVEPDLIIINAGSNDETGGTNASAMQTGTLAFLRQIRAEFPNAEIIWCYGGIGVNGAIENGIVGAIMQMGDSHISYRTLGKVSATGTYGHPDLAGHETLKNGLISIIESVMGW